MIHTTKKYLTKLNVHINKMFIIGAFLLQWQNRKRSKEVNFGRLYLNLSKTTGRAKTFRGNVFTGVRDSIKQK